MTRVRIVPVGTGKPLAKLAPQMQQAVQIALREETALVRRDYELTVRTWRNKPEFTERQTSDAVTVSTDNQIYEYVDKGTRPHMIRPKKAKKLRFFREGFQSKTTPNNLYARKGRQANKGLTFSDSVHHPGFEGRNFTTLIKAKSQKRLATSFQKRIKLLLAKKG